MLPDDGTNRTKIVKWAAAEYHKRYGDTIITDSWYRKYRKQVRGIIRSTVLDRKYNCQNIKHAQKLCEMNENASQKYHVKININQHIVIITHSINNYYFNLGTKE